jgi:hypothetical protein
MSGHRFTDHAIEFLQFSLSYCMVIVMFTSGKEMRWQFVAPKKRKISAALGHSCRDSWWALHVDPLLLERELT